MKPIEVGFDGSFKIDNNLVNCFLIPSNSMDLKGGDCLTLSIKIGFCGDSQRDLKFNLVL